MKILMKSALMLRGVKREVTPIVCKVSLCVTLRSSPGGCGSWTSQPLWVPCDNNEKNGGDENEGDGEEEGRRGGLVLMERRRRGSRGFISSGEVV